MNTKHKVRSLVSLLLIVCILHLSVGCAVGVPEEVPIDNIDNQIILDQSKRIYLHQNDSSWLLYKPGMTDEQLTGFPISTQVLESLLLPNRLTLNPSEPLVTNDTGMVSIPISAITNLSDLERLNQIISAPPFYIGMYQSQRLFIILEPEIIDQYLQGYMLGLPLQKKPHEVHLYLNPDWSLDLEDQAIISIPLTAIDNAIYEFDKDKVALFALAIIVPLIIFVGIGIFPGGLGSSGSGGWL